jgi:nucleotide-binding universal stress UspA family protein
MERFKRILLYADPAANIEPALRYAAQVATHNHGAVTVVDCVDPVPGIVKTFFPATWNLQSIVAKDHEKRLEEIATRLRDEGVRATTKLLVGPTALEVTREVLRAGHDLVIKTAQGNRENKEMAFFSTATIRLMRICGCPVWVVDPDETDRFDRILAAVDPSTDDLNHMQLNSEVLDLAGDLAEWGGGRLYIVYAWAPYGETVLRTRMSEESLRKYIEDSRRHAENEMAYLLAQFGKRITASSVHLLRGDPHEAIPDFALQGGIDLIVMGTVGRTGISGFLMGNTAERVLRRVQCSVLALKPDTFVSPVKLDKREGQASANADRVRNSPGLVLITQQRAGE